MKRRGFFGKVENDQLVVKAPEPGASTEPILPASHPDAKKQLEEMALRDASRDPRHRKDSFFRSILRFFVIRSFLYFFAGVVAFGGLFYDASLHRGTLRETGEQYAAVFGAIFGLFLWRWSRR